MTSITPSRVWYDITLYEASLYPAELDVENIVATMDMDANALCAVDVTLRSATDAQWALLDPRAIGVSPSIFFNVKQMGDRTPDPLTVLPGYDANPSGRMYLREVERDDISGQVRIRATSGEPMLSDKRRLATTAANTGATNVENLFTYSLFDIFGGISYSVDPIVSSTTIPVGDRRTMLQGESHLELLMPELQAIDCRVYDYWGRVWWAKSRTSPPTYVGAPTTVKLASYTQADGAPADADPIVHSVTRRISRDGDWADGILVRGEYATATGTAPTRWWQRSGSGVNTRGRVIDMNRAEPAGNIANQIATRSVIRGAEFTVTAAIRFDVRPGQTLEVYTRKGMTSANIRAVTWDIAANLMTIRAETGSPL